VGLTEGGSAGDSCGASVPLLRAAESRASYATRSAVARPLANPIWRAHPTSGVGSRIPLLSRSAGFESSKAVDLDQNITPDACSLAESCVGVICSCIQDRGDLST
jgi:hypothetical protein